MKILITGTHFTPAQALIERLNQGSSHDIVYVGRKSTREGDKSGSIESQVLPKLGVQFIPIVSGRFTRSLSIWTLISLLKLPIGFLQSFWVVLKEQPEVIVSFGGYLAFPVVFWGWWFNIPIVIHEQTLRFGLANWLSLPFASKVAVSFNTFKKGPKIEVTGNPIRKELLEPHKPGADVGKFLKSADKKPLLLIMGGNQGSHFINRLIGKCLPELTKSYAIVHQTGDSKLGDYEYLLEEQKKIPNALYFPTKWLDSDDLSAVLEQTDLVICRAGMNTLYELALKGKPALVIPIPTSVNSEQTHNAKFFAKAGLGEYMNQGEVSEQVLLQHLPVIMKNLAKFKPTAESQAIFLPDGVERLAQLVLGIKSLA